MVAQRTLNGEENHVARIRDGPKLLFRGNPCPAEGRIGINLYGNLLPSSSSDDEKIFMDFTCSHNLDSVRALYEEQI